MSNKTKLLRSPVSGLYYVKTNNFTGTREQATPVTDSEIAAIRLCFCGEIEEVEITQPGRVRAQSQNPYIAARQQLAPILRRASGSRFLIMHRGKSLRRKVTIPGSAIAAAYCRIEGVDYGIRLVNGVLTTD